jgi:hypothetical protein
MPENKDAVPDDSLLEEIVQNQENKKVFHAWQGGIRNAKHATEKSREALLLPVLPKVPTLPPALPTQQHQHQHQQQQQQQQLPPPLPPFPAVSQNQQHLDGGPLLPDPDSELPVPGLHMYRYVLAHSLASLSRLCSEPLPPVPLPPPPAPTTPLRLPAQPMEQQDCKGEAPGAPALGPMEVVATLSPRGEVQAVNSSGNRSRITLGSGSQAGGAAGLLQLAREALELEPLRTAECFNKPAGNDNSAEDWTDVLRDNPCDSDYVAERQPRGKVVMMVAATPKEQMVSSAKAALPPAGILATQWEGKHCFVSEVLLLARELQGRNFFSHVEVVTDAVIFRDVPLLCADGANLERMSQKLRNLQKIGELASLGPDDVVVVEYAGWAAFSSLAGLPALMAKVCNGLRVLFPNLGAAVPLLDPVAVAEQADKAKWLTELAAEGWSWATVGVSITKDYFDIPMLHAIQDLLARSEPCGCNQDSDPLIIARVGGTSACQGVVTLESQHPSEREREQMLKIMDGTEEDSVRWTLQLFHRCTAMCELDVVMASGEALSCVWGKGGRDEQTGYFEKDLKPIDSRTQVDIGKTVVKLAGCQTFAMQAAEAQVAPILVAALPCAANTEVRLLGRLDFGVCPGKAKQLVLVEFETACSGVRTLFNTEFAAQLEMHVVPLAEGFEAVTKACLERRQLFSESKRRKKYLDWH